ncbi:anti-sigma factor [Methanobrevibacter arboriphilus JCM 13429 = DSM 1125]|uniref:Anti-sigma factor n=2 Tax=Methanobrevibacter arboriphilus TaxID=39441 RepID=A0A1V6N2F6_METAZ|nr:ATP-binding protein [Methanobrevibacter arboriphilus]OQD58772.1 anti-sigma factor [Methanobrevibacter arboriphilus JCM 13429 = DSM 1125]
MKQIIVCNNKQQLYDVLNFVKKNLDPYKVSKKFQMQLELSIEEIFINIVNHAYETHANERKILINSYIETDPLKIALEFLDEGTPYNPLENHDPNISLPLEERSIGGLGIYLAKKNVDSIDYKYKDEKNILTIKKNIE